MNRNGSDKNHVLGIDIGGTGIKVAPVDLSSGKLLSDPQKEATPRPATPDTMIPVVEKLVNHFQWEGTIGCGFPGIVKRGIIYSAANLDDGWLEFPLRDKLSKRFSLPISLINDADAAGLAELKFGVGKKWSEPGSGVVLFFTLGTGIGSAIFLDGKLLPNTEFGHMELRGKDAEEWAATVVQEKENLSWEEWGKRVNEFLLKMEFLFSPDVIIIGGGISEDPQKFFPYLTLETEILAARMANEAGIVGAAMSSRI
ncbi:MAG: ROK family protein [Calditrichaeota bacterium]|nr:ROK family protein [Calditrichota bacterium]